MNTRESDRRTELMDNAREEFAKFWHGELLRDCIKRLSEGEQIRAEIHCWRGFLAGKGLAK